MQSLLNWLAAIGKKKSPQKAWRYKAFISYKHLGGAKFAIDLEIALKKYAKPLLAPPLRIFRDEKHLAPGCDLSKRIKSALDNSEFFILLASKAAAISPWVHDEVAVWCEQLGRTDRLIVILLDGEISFEPGSKKIDWTKTDALPKVLQSHLPSMPLYVDLRDIAATDVTLDEPRFKQAVNGIVARFRNVDPNDLLGEEVAQHHRNLRLRNGAIAALALLTTISVSAAYLAQDESIRARTALLESAARASLLLAQDDQPEEGWSGLKKAITSARSGLLFRNVALPESVGDAGLTSLIDDRSGPTLTLSLSDVSAAQVAGDELGPSAGAFTFDGRLVAAARYNEVGVWRTEGGHPELRLTLDHTVERVSFSRDGRTLIAVGSKYRSDQVKGASEQTKDVYATAIDISSGKYKTYLVENCNGIPCIIFDGRRGALKDIDELDSRNLLVPVDGVATVSFPHGRLIVPTASFKGLTGGRFYVFLDEDNWNLSIFDRITQITENFHIKGNNVAVAREKPILITGPYVESEGAALKLYRIVVSNGRILLSPWHTWNAEGSAGVENLSLSPDGNTLYFSMHRWGTGGGVGGRATMAMDSRSGRRLWSKLFEGDIVYSQSGTLQAQHSSRTKIVSSETAEGIFSLDGVPVTFSPDGRTLLTDATERMPATKPSSVSWRLFEIIQRSKLASDDGLPRSLRSACNLNVSRFRALGDHIGRRWNTYDWGVISNAQRRTPLVSVRADDSKITQRLVFEFKKKGISVFDASTSFSEYSSHSVPETEWRRMASQFAIPLTYKPDSQVTLSVSTSKDRLWGAVAVVYDVALPSQKAGDDGDDDRRDRWMAWRVFDSRRADRVVASGEMREKETNSAGISAFDNIGVSFATGIPAAFVQLDECTMRVIELPSGRILGDVDLAFSNNVTAMSVSPDLFAIRSTDWYESTESIQVLSYPSLRQGPWLIFGEYDSDDPQEAPKNAQGAPGDSEIADSENSCQQKFRFSEDGLYLVAVPVSGDDCKTKADEGVTVYKVPPWGNRLDKLLTAP